MSHLKTAPHPGAQVFVEPSITTTTKALPKRRVILLCRRQVDVLRDRRIHRRIQKHKLSQTQCLLQLLPIRRERRVKQRRGRVGSHKQIVPVRPPPVGVLPEGHVTVDRQRDPVPRHGPPGRGHQPPVLRAPGRAPHRDLPAGESLVRGAEGERQRQEQQEARARQPAHALREGRVAQEGLEVAERGAPVADLEHDEGELGLALRAAGHDVEGETDDDDLVGLAELQGEGGDPDGEDGDGEGGEGDEDGAGVDPGREAFGGRLALPLV